MPIRPSQIDLQLGEALRDRAAQIFAPNAALDPVSARFRQFGARQWQRALQKHALHFWLAGGIFLGSLLCLPPLVSAGHDTAAGIALWLSFAVSAGLAVWGHRRTTRELTQLLPAETMRLAPQLLECSPAERVYCEAVAALVDAESVLGDTAQSDLMEQLNGLLTSYRRLDEPLRRLRPGSGEDTIVEMERELSDLQARRDSLDDADARATLDHAMALCAERLDAVRTRAPARERAEAQQALILQAIASLTASLERMRPDAPGAAEAAGADLAAVAEVEDLRRNVTEIRSQTRAVEEAVEEVLSLRSTAG